jgi:hypothetical protein
MTEQVFTSFHPRVTCSPPESPDPEKSRVNTVIFEGSKIIAASLASALHPLSINIAPNQHGPIKLKSINYTTPNASQRREKNRIQGVENKIRMHVFIVKDMHVISFK